MAKITHVEIRMYRLGTGDCFAIKFLAGDRVQFKMLVDAGVWSGPQARIQPMVADLMDYLEHKVDVLVVTHEHKDHVYAFEACADLFGPDQFEAGALWMAWTEHEGTKKVKEWRQKYGEQKKALGIAARKLQDAVGSNGFKAQLAGNQFGMQALEARKAFADVVRDFADLHFSKDEQGLYKGGLAGMEIAKNTIAKGEVKYFQPGDVISDVEGLEGVNIYVLGPPKLYEQVAKEAGGKGESFDHNDLLKKSGAFGAAVSQLDTPESLNDGLLPFDNEFVEQTGTDVETLYQNQVWRRIDHDWLFSAGSFALRMNGLTNNLSLALAIEFEESGRVLLFPGDAEYGSWASWHDIKWEQKGRDGTTPLTEDLLNRTVFYKVAHHMSHNGTAQKLGLEMMKHRDLAAMATLDYGVISNGWKSTMPNRAILKELLARTKGRLMILNEENLFQDFHGKEPVREAVVAARARMSKKERETFEKSLLENEMYIQYTVKT